MAQGGAFFGDLVLAAGERASDMAATLWLLVWAGEVTNDAYAPVRAPRALRTSVRHVTAGGRRLRRRSSATSPAIAGRWLPAAPLFEGATEAERARARAEILLERHGVVTRAACGRGRQRRLRRPLRRLSALELTGAARRGYFVEGLGGAQFALPGAVSGSATCARPAASRRP